MTAIPTGLTAVQRMVFQAVDSLEQGGNRDDVSRALRQKFNYDITDGALRLSLKNMIEKGVIAVNENSDQHRGEIYSTVDKAAATIDRLIAEQQDRLQKNDTAMREFWPQVQATYVEMAARIGRDEWPDNLERDNEYDRFYNSWQRFQGAISAIKQAKRRINDLNYQKQNG